MKRKKQEMKTNEKVNKILITITSLIVLVIIIGIGINIFKYKNIVKNKEKFDINNFKIISASEIVFKNEIKYLDLYNDIYIDIKNVKEKIKSVIVKNIEITNKKGNKEILIYSPKENKNNIFEEEQENLIQKEIEFINNTDETKIIFRNYLKNIKEIQDVNNKALTEDEINQNKYTLKFELKINLENNKSYSRNFEIELPLIEFTNQSEKSERTIDTESLEFKEN